MELPDRRESMRDAIALLRVIRSNNSAAWDLITSLEYMEQIGVMVTLVQILNVAIDGSVEAGVFTSADKVYEMLLEKLNDTN